MTDPEPFDARLREGNTVLLFVRVRYLFASRSSALRVPAAAIARGIEGMYPGSAHCCRSLSLSLSPQIDHSIIEIATRAAKAPRAREHAAARTRARFIRVRWPRSPGHRAVA